MSLMKVAAWRTAVLLIALAALFKKAPHLLLKAPGPLGFIFHNIAGGNGGLMPPYFDVTPWTDGRYRDWLRDGDVVVATGAKAGTTWMCYCTDAIRRKGRDDVGHPYTDIMYTTPWMEVQQKPGMSWDERSALMNSTVLPDGTKIKDYWDNPAFPFRIFKSHYMPIGQGPFDVLPVKEMPNIKFIAAVRNPYEVGKSVHTFFPKHTDEFKKTWGGFPPDYPDAGAAMRDMFPGGNIYSFFFPYVRAWWPFREEPNVLLLHYSDMVKDTAALVKKLASFIGVALTAEEEAKVVEKCSFAHMKKHAGLFDYRLPANPGLTLMKSGAQIASGKAGKENVVSVGDDVLKEMEKLMETELPDLESRRWAHEGGPW